VNSTQALVDLLKFWTIGLKNDPVAQDALINKLLELYPDDPALGSPFGTGSETFGRSATWKRGSAIANDIFMDADRRWLLNAAAKVGLKSYGYLFSDPQPSGGVLPGGKWFRYYSSFSETVGAVAHTTEIPYVFGGLWQTPIGPSGPGFEKLSPIVIDYWISFAASGSPNDGKGADSKCLNNRARHL
jgi:acetylcholinesterase